MVCQENIVKARIIVIARIVIAKLDCSKNWLGEGDGHGGSKKKKEEKK